MSFSKPVLASAGAYSRAGLVSRVAVVVLLLLVLVASPNARAADDVETDPADALMTRIWELRMEGSYAEATVLARELLEHLKASEDAAPYEVTTAEVLLETVEFAAALAPADQAELATADSLLQALEESHAAREYDLMLRQSERAMAVRARILGDGHVETADAVEYLGLALQGKQDTEAAIELYRDVLEVRISAYGEEHPDVAIAFVNMAIALKKMSDFDGAESYYLRALELKRRLFGGGSEEVSVVLGGLGGLHFHAGKLGQSEQLYRERLEIVYALDGDRSGSAARALNNLAVVVQNRGDLAAAESFILEALSIYRELFGNEHMKVETSLNNLATLYYKRGDYASAESMFREGAALSRKLEGDDSEDLATRLFNLAVTMQARGNYAGAEPAYREALLIRRRIHGEEHRDVATCLNGLAGLQQRRGDYATAGALHREALAMRRKLLGDEHPSVSTSLHHVAAIMRLQGDYTGAEPLFREALAISRQVYGDEHVQVSTDISSLALVLQSKGDHEGAESLFREALAMRRTVLGEEHPRVAASMHDLAGLLRLKGEYAEPEELYVAALKMRRDLLCESHPNVSATLMSLAGLHMSQGDYASAEPLLTEAAESYEAARLRAGSGLAGTTFTTSPYPSLAATRLELGMENGAWPACEMSLGRALADMLWVSAGRRLAQHEAAREDSLRLALSDAETFLAGLEREAKVDPSAAVSDRMAELRLEVAALEVDWSTLQTELAQKYPVASGRVESLDEVQAALGDGEAIVGWLDVGVTGGEHLAWGYVVRRDSPVAWARLPVDGSDADSDPYDARDAFSAALSDVATPGLALRRDARRMWAQRVEPLMPFLDGVEYVTAVTSGAMSGLPLEVFADPDGETLGERFIVSYAPSASIYALLAERGEPAGTRTLLAGDPPYNDDQLAQMEDESLSGELYAAIDTAPVDGWVLRSALGANREALSSLPRLPGSRAEIEAIQSATPEPMVLLGPRASEEEFLALSESGELREFSTLHIATHAIMDSDHPDNSALVMSQTGLPDALETATMGGRIYDGLISAKEIAREWDLDADLVTLSACETGLGRKVSGEGHIGFAHALFQAGARSLLVSLWKVEDRATAMFMRRFYENLFGGYDDERAGHTGESMSKAEALREAKFWLRDYVDDAGRTPYEHPYYWSAFVLIGDGS